MTLMRLRRLGATGTSVFGPPALVAAVLVAGLLVSMAVFGAVRGAQRENAERVMDQRAAVAHSAVLTEAQRYSSLLQATAAGLATGGEISWDDFDAATSPLASARLIGASSVSFVVPSTTAEIPATQRLWRSRGSDGLVLRPVAGSQEHYFSIFSRALKSSPAANGLDLAAARQPAEALVDARRMSTTTVSDTYVLLRDRNLPAEQQQHSFVFAAPIWPRGNDPEFSGWLVLGMRGQDFLSGVLADVSQGQLDAELLAANVDGSHPAVARYDVPGHPGLERRSLLDVADREWTLVVRADAGNLPGARSSLPVAVLSGSLAITLILAGLVHVLATGRERAVTRVREATAELRAAEEESRRQAGLLGAVMSSISDGVGVVDESGDFLLHNPAAKQLLGVDEDIGDAEAWQEHYGLFRPDGRTPYPAGELPLIRALNGEAPDGVEMIIRNAARPEGLLISVDARPLDPSAGQRGAVAVFHDITELRRYETDLAVFAGVVAHDLKAPLTVVRGHCEAAEELLEAATSPESSEARDALRRSIRAVDRMAVMIDTLLAYTTARDAPLSPATVDLGALVAEVVQDRTAHLPAAHRPEIVVGPLPPVRADPAMLRHVLDNLIGNALKYVRADAAARVEVTAAPDAPGLTRIQVADRGIGIPDADKPAVFERFHRAHAGAGYAGTGLGLAICKRIVERHGGEIGVEDNPGGGTRFHFTLPLQTRSTSGQEYAMTKDPHADDEQEARAKLERALAERAAAADVRLPGVIALPAAEPAAHDPAAAPPRSPVPHRQSPE